MNRILFLGCYLLLNILLVRSQTRTSVIYIDSGPIRGLISSTIKNKEYAAFKGIPYAKPPIGHLRFKPPVPVDAWTDVYNATKEGNACTQIIYDGDSVYGSEDCLYINVYTPHTNFDEAISKPVMVWIYGGAFSTGDSSQLTYGPDFILGEDVILVAFNYRLSAFGFLNLEHENATGNCALKDQNLALKWVKRNIAKFGGNPDKITIFGESAGSVCVDLHILSDMSVGLFNRSISMSGSTLNLFWSFQSRVDALANGFKLGSMLGINTLSKDQLLEALRNASAADIITAANKLFFKPTLENSNIAPNEKKFLTTCSLKKYRNGNYTKGPHMLGFAADEALLYVGGQFNETKSFLESIKAKASDIPLLSSVVSAITTGIENLTESASYELAQKLTDLLFVLGIDAKQILMSRNNDYPIYYYRFSFQSNHSLHKALGVSLEGAAHGDDFPYVFYAPYAQLPLDQPDIATTRRRMVNLWTSFAKYGNPTPDGEDDAILGITWPDSRLSGEHLEIGKDLTIGPRPTSRFVEILHFFGLGLYTTRITPIINYGVDDSVLGIIWPDSRPDRTYLDIGKTLTTGLRPTSNFVRIF